MIKIDGIEKTTVSLREFDTDVEITYYRLHEFSKLFEFNNLSMSLLEKSLSPILNTEQVFQTGEGAGKSGSFFFLSHDSKFMIKTMKEAELKTMLKILPSYIEHHRRNPNSLLSKIFGIFTIRKKGMFQQHVMLMENTLQLKDSAMQKCVYDLKGSTAGRYTKGKMTRKTIRKDLDWVKDKKRNANLLSLSPVNCSIIKVLRRDVAYLKLKGLLDYSLLLAVEESKEKFDKNEIIAERNFASSIMSKKGR